MKLRIKREKLVTKEHYEWTCRLSGLNDSIGFGRGHTPEEAFDNYTYSIIDALNFEGWNRYNNHPEYLWCRKEGIIG